MELPTSKLILSPDVGSETLSPEKILEAIHSCVQDAIIVMDPRGCVTYWNKAAERIFGYRAEEIIGSNLHQLIAPSRFHAAHEVNFASFKSNGKGGAIGKTVQLAAIRKGGEEFPIELSLSSIEGKDGWSAIGAIRDISERVKAEQEIRQQERLLDLAIEQMPVPLVIADAPNGNIYKMNSAARELMDGDIEESLIVPIAKYRDYWRTFYPDGRPYDVGDLPISRAVINGEVVRGVEMMLRKGEEVRWVLKSAVPLLDEHGRVVAGIEVFPDITERKAVEKNLEDQRLFLELLLNTIPSPIFYKDRGGCYRGCNRAFAEEVLGITPEEIIGHTIFELSKVIPEALARRYHEADLALMETGGIQRYEAEVKYADGKIRDVLFTKACSFSGNGEIAGVIGLMQDLSDIKRSTQELEEREKSFRAVWEAVQAGLAVIDKSTQHIVDVNPAALRLMERSREEVIGKDFRCILSSDEGEKGGEGILVTNIGDRIPILKTVTPLVYHGRDCLLDSFVELTQQKKVEAELREVSEMAKAADKSKSEFLANMSHEIRTPLNGILGIAELLGDTDLDEDQRDLLDTISGSGESLLSIINDILDLSKIEAGMLHLELRSFSVREVLQDLEGVFAYQLTQRKLTFVSEVHELVPKWLVGDPNRVRQVLLNLVGNSIKFTPDNGAIIVLVELLSVENDHVVLMFSVNDSGVGIPIEKQRLVFEPFQQADGSTSRIYGGTGLGLSIASRLVGLMGGRINLRSQSNLGTRVSFTAEFLDSHDQPLDGSEPRSHVKDDFLDFDPTTLRILVVEDNLVNQKLACGILRREGFCVEMAINGEEALDVLSRESFDIILMDIQMPEMDGYQCTREIRARERDCDYKTPIVAITAHAMREEQERCLDAGMDSYLSKPYKASQLIEIVRKMARRGRPEDN